MIQAGRQLDRFTPPTNEELAGDGLFEVEERAVPGPPGGPEVSLLICRPTGTGDLRPILYNIHGGGMVVGSHRVGMPLDLAEELGLVMVSVEYRLAPEHPHPAPVEDCYAGLLWTAEHAKEIGGDPTASSWWAAARAEGSSRRWHCWPATGAARVRSASC